MGKSVLIGLEIVLFRRYSHFHSQLIVGRNSSGNSKNKLSELYRNHYELSGSEVFRAIYFISGFRC